MATAGLRLLLRAANRRLPQWPLQHARPSQARPLAPAHVAGRSYASTPNTDGGKPGACVCALSAVVCVPYSVAAQLCAPVAGSSLHEWQPARARGGAGRQDAPLVLARPLRARVWPGVALNQHARTHARACARKMPVRARAQPCDAAATPCLGPTRARCSQPRWPGRHRVPPADGHPAPRQRRGGGAKAGAGQRFG